MISKNIRMNAGCGAVFLVLLATAVAAQAVYDVNAVQRTEIDTETATTTGGFCSKKVPGWKKGPFITECDSEENCTQCCDAQCNLVTCNDCVGCKNQCHTGTIKKKTLYVDITCNLDESGMECILCNCPAYWGGDIPECAKNSLEEALMKKATNIAECGQAKTLDSLTLMCGQSTKNWKQILASDSSCPKGYPYQCKNSESGKCIVSDRSFPNVKIVIEQECELSGDGPSCTQFEKIINTDCKKCVPGVKESSLTTRTGQVTETTQYCTKGNSFCSTVDSKCSVHFSEPPCTKKCKHASKDGTCKYCKVSKKLVNRTPPLCVASRASELYEGCSPSEESAD
uniref:Uncharacterized protein n=1 Tax=Rhodosorus marinus TaxID=101924 RepID=A0A7S3EHY7_9RHOD|mmetsp:Transcript_33985/g.133270  ORF Transcript_33985/g.133270 Transcript_33985/m.133270 type:complete len:341 (+) Transcript_33985:61-1083(+)